MQKDKTLHFWDDYYRKEESTVKEWILQPSNALVQQILAQLSHVHNENETSVLRILEIGCGTSLLSMELCTAWERLQSRCRLHVLATDVSHVCIEQQQLEQRHRRTTSDDLESMATLEYRVLNITEQHYKDDSDESKGRFHLILDKGCLDTCLFRSKKADEWLDSVLYNLHSWLTPETGVYVIVTPRSKLKAVRDFPGFIVTRQILAETEFGSGDLEPRSGTKSDANETGTEPTARQYMYTCRHQTYDVAAALLNPIPIEVSTLASELPANDERCRLCGVVFSVFRSQQQHTRSGHRTDAQWRRQWLGHQQHCKPMRWNDSLDL